MALPESRVMASIIALEMGARESNDCAGNVI